MSFGLNRAEVIGRLGADITVNHLVSGGRVANMSIATDEGYIDRNSGDRVDKTEWHRVVTFQPGLIDMLTKNAKKGPPGLRRGQDADPALAQGRRGLRPLLHRDPAGARFADPVPRSRQRRGGRGARERFGDAGRRRPRRRPTTWRTRFRFEILSSHPPDWAGASCAGLLFCSRPGARPRTLPRPAGGRGEPVAGKPSK